MGAYPLVFVCPAHGVFRSLSRGGSSHQIFPSTPPTDRGHRSSDEDSCPLSRLSTSRAETSFHCELTREDFWPAAAREAWTAYERPRTVSSLQPPNRRYDCTPEKQPPISDAGTCAEDVPDQCPFPTLSSSKTLRIFFRRHHSTAVDEGKLAKGCIHGAAGFGQIHSGGWYRIVLEGRVESIIEKPSISSCQQRDSPAICSASHPGKVKTALSNKEG